MSKNYSFSAMPAIINDNNDDYMGNYDVELVSNKLNKQRSKKNNDFNNEIQLQINNRTLQSRNRDARYSLKNRRTVNNDWKMFNYNQSIPEQVNWNWDFSFDHDDSYYFEESSIQSSSVQVSPALTCASSSSYLKSFDIPLVEL